MFLNILQYTTLPVNPHAALLECLNHQCRHFTKECTRHGGVHGVRKLIRKVEGQDRRPGVGVVNNRTAAGMLETPRCLKHLEKRC